MTPPTDLPLIRRDGGAGAGVGVSGLSGVSGLPAGVSAVPAECGRGRVRRERAGFRL